MLYSDELNSIKYIENSCSGCRGFSNDWNTFVFSFALFLRYVICWLYRKEKYLRKNVRQKKMEIFQKEKQLKEGFQKHKKNHALHTQLRNKASRHQYGSVSVVFSST